MPPYFTSESAAAIRGGKYLVTELSIFAVVLSLLSSYDDINLYSAESDLTFVPDLRFHICLWLGALSLALWVNLVGTVLSSDNAHFRAVYILSSLIMMTASGVMVPAVYLPDMLRKISGVIPTGALHGMLMSGFWESAGIREPGDIPGLTVTLITDAAVLLFSMIFATGRDRK